MARPLSDGSPADTLPGKLHVFWAEAPLRALPEACACSRAGPCRGARHTPLALFGKRHSWVPVMLLSLKISDYDK